MHGMRRIKPWFGRAVALTLLLSIALAHPAMAEEELADLIAKSYKALRTRNFEAVLLIQSVGKTGELESAQFRLYRLSDNTTRIEPVSQIHRIGSYILETDEGTFRVMSEMRTAFLVPGRRVGSAFELLERFLSPKTPSAEIRTERTVLRGEEFYRIYSEPDNVGRSRIQVLVSPSDFLPREINLFLVMDRPGISLRLDQLKTRPTDYFPEDFFRVPRLFRVIRTEEPRIPELRARIEQLRRRHRGMMEEQEKKPTLLGGQEDFLPLLPANLPQGFSISSIDPLFFKGDLVFHIKITLPEDQGLVSLFEAKDSQLIEEAGSLVKTDGLNVLSTTTEQGIFALLVSEELNEEELRQIADSLRENPELALELLEPIINRNDAME